MWLYDIFHLRSLYINIYVSDWLTFFIKKKKKEKKRERERKKRSWDEKRRGEYLARKVQVEIAAAKQGYDSEPWTVVDQCRAAVYVERTRVR